MEIYVLVVAAPTVNRQIVIDGFEEANAGNMCCGHDDLVNVCIERVKTCSSPQHEAEVPYPCLVLSRGWCIRIHGYAYMLGLCPRWSFTTEQNCRDKNRDKQGLHCTVFSLCFYSEW